MSTIFSGSSMASISFSVSSRSFRAPTGQWVMHWPQSAHLESSRRYTPATSTAVREPVLTRSQMPEAWILSQTWMQRMHLMHFA